MRLKQLQIVYNLAYTIWRRCRSAITPKTKMIIINTPHNPVGKVFTREELEYIASLAEKFNLLVMSDEVVSTGALCA